MARRSGFVSDETPFDDAASALLHRLAAVRHELGCQMTFDDTQATMLAKIAEAEKLTVEDVRRILDFQLEFFQRQGVTAKVKMGVKKDGRITALDFKLYWDAGAYVEYGANVVNVSFKVTGTVNYTP